MIISPRRKGTGSGTTTGAKGQYDKTYIAKVMDNTDIELMGRLRVYIPEFGGDPANSDNWITVSYCSPFAGATNPWSNLSAEILPSDAAAQRKNAAERKPNLGNVRDGTRHDDTQQSYGFWFIPPDIYNDVVVAFAAGDPTKGYWFGCLYQQQMNHMVPGIAANKSHQDSACKDKDPPVSEYNRLVTDPARGDRSLRPEFTPLNKGLALQGLSCDPLRGITSSSARREAPSEVFGILTPKGNQFVMDDKKGSEFIRLRTKSGTQILLSETEGHVYLISRDGDSWLELNNSGHVDIYAAKSISLHSETSINLRADQDINIEAGRNFNVKSVKGYGRIQTATDLDIHNGAAFHHTTVGKHDTHVGGSSHHMAVGSVNVLSGGDACHQSGGTINLGAGGEVVASGSNIHLNTKAAAAAGTAGEAKVPDIYKLPTNRSVKQSATDRVPEHEPWKPHAASEGTTSQRPDTVIVPGDDPDNEGLNFGTDTGSTPGSTPETSDPAAEEIPPEPTPGDCVAVSQLRTSERGKLMILTHEAFMAYIYPDAGNWAIGYGHNASLATLTRQFPNGLTEEEAYDLFSRDIMGFEQKVRSGITGCMTQQMFDAAVSLTYNLGRFPSEIKAAINARNYTDAAKQFRSYRRAGGVVLPALVQRRDQEANLFLNSSYPPAKTRAEQKAGHLRQIERRYPRNLYHANAAVTEIQVTQAAAAYSRMTGRNLGASA
jgi:GH24 family phage-related lysozyme (muramidase)